MASKFEDRVCDVTQQLLTTINEQSLEVEARHKHSSVLLAELDTQMHELQAAARALSAARRNCTFDIGIRK
ncbi:hypothetical protein IWW55_007315 [Coemansia sp. RSA 2706]|nr:hypothetical protein LPJ63_001230 [Coemansia sp. RSA 2711]KAJ1848710.1 hypothetical protein LPJ70_000887 [Coemansia sp. RSA 2708]KAJ2285242.1 hypothetical protein IWW55_007315 [Coemansia sp. RSA 2706]KAJ2302528.1 hypothetical protein IWW52_006977 [Coemansia sp. RSA 2704]KAJ2306680.1 hypothetical protein IWW54_004660 [Coemansia sp. RSA 2705]KAJ2361431.1 hypothetical protein H4S01_005266 [Coemansia sp. RSA 2610]